MLESLPPPKSYTIPNTTPPHTYSYIHIPSTSSTGSKHPTLLFIHGFPSHSVDWIHQINHFRNQRYPILAIDLLGFGNSSAPDDVSSYTLNRTSGDMASLLSHLSINKVVGIGHDIGATILSRFAAFHPSMFAGCVYISVGPSKLGTKFDLDGINTMTKEAMGFEMLGYMSFLARGANEPEVQTVLEKNAESVMSLMFCADEKTEWPKHFRPTRSMEEFVQKREMVQVADWYTTELRNAHMRVFGKDAGYAGTTRWYASWKENLSLEAEKQKDDFVLQMPSTLIGPSDAVDMQARFLKEWAEDLEVKNIDGGHWLHLQRPQEVNEAIEGLLRRI